MALREFTRLTDRVLARLGEDAVLRGETAIPPIKVAVEFGVEMQGSNGEVTVVKAVATMKAALAPKKNDTLVVGVDSYIVDSPPFAANGYSVRVVLRDA